MQSRPCLPQIGQSVPVCRRVMFCLSQNHGGSSCHETRTTSATALRAKHPKMEKLILPHHVESSLSLSRRSRLSDRLTEALGTSDQGTSAQANCKV